MDDLLAAASAALGATLTDRRDLGGSERSAVWRCRMAGGGTVVVKNYPGTAEGAESFAAEAAGLALAAPSGAGPRLLAASAPARLVVMSDLGQAPSLADVVLADSPAAAEAGRFTRRSGDRLTAGPGHGQMAAAARPTVRFWARRMSVADPRVGP